MEQSQSDQPAYTQDGEVVQPPQSLIPAWDGSLPDKFRKFPMLRSVIEELDPQGETVDWMAFLNQPILIKDVQLFTGQYGKFAYVRFVDAQGVLYNMTVGGGVVVRKLEQVRERLPLVAIPIQREGGAYGRYYDID